MLGFWCFEIVVRASTHPTGLSNVAKLRACHHGLLHLLLIRSHLLHLLSLLEMLHLLLHKLLAQLRLLALGVCWLLAKQRPHPIKPRHKPSSCGSCCSHQLLLLYLRLLGVHT